MNNIRIPIGVALLCMMVGAVRSSSTVARVLQSGAIVNGIVRDQTGAVVVNAQVLMLNLANERQLITRTDSFGKYEFEGLSPGLYQISISSEGFAAVTRSISLQRNGSYREDFLLAPSPTSNRADRKRFCGCCREPGRQQWSTFGWEVVLRGIVHLRSKRGRRWRQIASRPGYHSLMKRSACKSLCY